MSYIQNSLTKIGAKRFVNFIQYVKHDDHVTSIQDVKKKLDSGTSIEDVLFEREQGALEEYGQGGYVLNIKLLDESSFRIDFGYAFGTAGSGGEWDVSFNIEGSVIEVKGISIWNA